MSELNTCFFSAYQRLKNCSTDTSSKGVSRAVWSLHPFSFYLNLQCAVQSSYLLNFKNFKQFKAVIRGNTEVNFNANCLKKRTLNLM